MARTKNTARKLPVGGGKTPRKLLLASKGKKKKSPGQRKKRRWRPGTVAVSIMYDSLY